MGFLDAILVGLSVVHAAKEVSSITKVHSDNWQENNQCDLYFYHQKTHLALLYAEACSPGGYTCFGKWCRMNGYWNTAYQYLKIAAHTGTLMSRCEFTRVCFVLGKYEEAIEFGMKYQYLNGWRPTLYTALSYFMLGDTEKCKELLMLIEQSDQKYDFERSLSRGFLHCEYGMDFEKIEKDYAADFFAKLAGDDTSDGLIPIDRNTAFEIASKKEDTSNYSSGGYQPFDIGGAILIPPDEPKEITYHFLVELDKWLKKDLPKDIQYYREERRKAVENCIKTLEDGECKDDAIIDARYLFNFQYVPETGKLIDAPRILPSPFDTAKIDELLTLDM